MGCGASSTTSKRYREKASNDLIQELRIAVVQNDVSTTKKKLHALEEHEADSSAARDCALIHLGIAVQAMAGKGSQESRKILLEWMKEHNFMCPELIEIEPKSKEITLMAEDHAKIKLSQASPASQPQSTYVSDVVASPISEVEPIASDSDGREKLQEGTVASPMAAVVEESGLLLVRPSSAASRVSTVPGEGGLLLTRPSSATSKVSSEAAGPGDGGLLLPGPSSASSKVSSEGASLSEVGSPRIVAKLKETDRIIYAGELAKGIVQHVGKCMTESDVQVDRLSESTLLDELSGEELSEWAAAQLDSSQSGAHTESSISCESVVSGASQREFSQTSPAQPSKSFTNSPLSISGMPRRPRQASMTGLIILEADANKQLHFQEIRELTRQRDQAVIKAARAKTLEEASLLEEMVQLLDSSLQEAREEYETLYEHLV